jgi:hypothetical protein
MKMYYLEAAVGELKIQYRVYGNNEDEAVCNVLAKVYREHPDFALAEVKFIDCPEEFECE